MTTPNYDAGMCMPTEAWLDLNTKEIFANPDLRRYVAPFPPAHLMQIVSGLTHETDFAVRGANIYRAFHNASRIPVSSYKNILDFGCGCAGLSRFFKGHPGEVTGCDIDGRLIDWITTNIDYMRAVQTQPNAALPFRDHTFDAVISNSVFTHLSEMSQHIYLGELSRVSQVGAYLFLTVHGERALKRAQTEERIVQMIEISPEELDNAAHGMRQGRHNFVIQRHGHLTTADYEYGITFIPEAYVRTVWGSHFEIIDILKGAIDDWQDIVVCRKP